MCTKFFADGDVHSYFNPYDSPYDAFINYMNVVSDFIERVKAYPKISKMSKAEAEAQILQYELEINKLKEHIKPKSIAGTKKIAKVIEKTKKAATPIDKTKEEPKAIAKPKAKRKTTTKKAGATTKKTTTKRTTSKKTDPKKKQE